MNSNNLMNNKQEISPWSIYNHPSLLLKQDKGKSPRHHSIKKEYLLDNDLSDLYQLENKFDRSLKRKKKSMQSILNFESDEQQICSKGSALSNYSTHTTQQQSRIKQELLHQIKIQSDSLKGMLEQKVILMLLQEKLKEQVEKQKEFQEKNQQVKSFVLKLPSIFPKKKSVLIEFQQKLSQDFHGYGRLTSQQVHQLLKRQIQDMISNRMKIMGKKKTISLKQ